MIRVTMLAESVERRARCGSSTLWIVLGIGAVVALAVAVAAAFFVLKSDRRTDAIAQATQPEAPVTIPTKADPPKVEPPKTNPTKSEPPKVEPPKVTPKPDDPLVMPAAASLPIQYKGEDGIALDTAYTPTALVVRTIPKPFSSESTFEVYDPKTCKRMTSFQVPGKHPFQSMAISADGTRIAILEGSEESAPEISVWTVAEGKEVRKRWSPANSKSGSSAEARATQVIWISFRADNKLLSLTQGGHFGCWVMDDEKPAFDVPLFAADSKQKLVSRLHYPVPANFSFSPDHSILAVQQTGGMILVDTATGRTTGELPAPKDIARLVSIDGMAFSPDGKKLAACYAFSAAPDSKTPKLEDKRIVIWDLAAKRVDVDTPLIRHVNSGSHWTWWGARHLIWHYGNAQSLILRADTGEIIRDCLPPSQHSTVKPILVDSLPDGKLRYLTNGFSAKFLVYDSPAEHLKADSVLDDGKGFYKRLILTDSGVEKMSAESIGTMRKFEIPKR